MKPFDDEREAFEQGFQYRNRERLANAFASRDAFVLSDAIDRVDVIDAFDTVPMGLGQPLALVHAVHP